jgi:DNA-binding transcriptional LysR family regulator
LAASLSNARGLPPHDSLLRQPVLTTFVLNKVEPPTEFVETLSLNVTLHYAIATMPESLARKYAARKALAVLPIELPRVVRPMGSSGCAVILGDPAFIGCLGQAAQELVAP